MNVIFNIKSIFLDRFRSLSQCLPFVHRHNVSKPKTKWGMGFAATFLFWMLAFFSPQTVFAKTAADLRTTIAGNGLTAGGTGNTVIVTGSRLNMNNIQYQLDIDKDVIVDWQATVSGTNATHLFNLSGDGEFRVSANGTNIGSITQTGTGRAINYSGDGGIGKVTVSGGSVKISNAVSESAVIFMKEPGSNLAVSGTGQVIHEGVGRGIDAVGNVEVSGTAQITTTTGTAIYLDGSNKKLTVSGGKISSAGYAIYVRYTDMTVDISSGEVSSTGAGENSNAITFHNLSSGKVIISGNGKVNNTASGPTISIGPDTTDPPTPNSSVSIEVRGGDITQGGTGRAIRTAGSVLVTAGTVTASNASGRAISLDESGTLTVTGGSVKATATGGTAIYAGGGNSKVIITGGTVSAQSSTNNAINLIGANSVAYVAAATSTITGAIPTNGANSIYVSKATATTTYPKGGNIDLTVSPTPPTATAVWDNNPGGESGITYTRSTNTGFLVIPGIMVGTSYTVNITEPVNGTISVTNTATNAPVTSGATLLSGTSLTLAATNSTPGYVFDKWWDGNTTNPRTYTLTQAVTISATFVQTFTVTFQFDNGNVDNIVTVKSGSTVTAPSPAPTKAGYRFLGWYNGDTPYVFTAPVTGNLTLTAKWIQTFEVSFDLNYTGATPLPKQTVDKDGKVTVPSPAPTRLGYVFLKWLLEGEAYDFNTAVTSSFTLTAQWGATVTFDYNDGGETPNGSVVVVEGEKVEAPKPAPTREGYRFEGWFDYANVRWDFENTAVTGAMKLTAKWTQIFTVTFDLDYEGAEAIPPQYVDEGKMAEQPDDPRRTGFTFLYWYLDDKDEAFDFENEAIVKDITLTAKWEVLTHTVTFMVDGEEYGEPQLVVDGELAEEPDAPEKDGFDFQGWLLDGVYFSFDTPIVSNITLTAKFTSSVDPETFTVTFNYNDGGATENKTVDVVEGKKVEEPKTPVREGYKFLGWFLNDREYDFNMPVSGNITLVAKWEEIPVFYTVTFVYGSDDTEEVEVEKGKLVNKPADPDKEGFIFLGWFDGFNIFDFKTPITKNITLTARWKNEDKTIIYTVTFDYNDTVTYDDKVEVEEGDTVEEPETPTREGYNFLGWFVDGIKFNFASPIFEDITLTAEWDLLPVKKHTVRFVYNYTGAPQDLVKEVEDKEKVEAPKDPERKGYKFMGWFKGNDKFNFDTAVTEDITLTAKWEEITGTEDILALDVNIYPNPFTNILNIKGAEGCVLQVINGNGVTVHVQKIENAEQAVTLGQLPQGLYFFRIQKDNQTITLKVVKN